MLDTTDAGNMLSYQSLEPRQNTLPGYIVTICPNKSGSLKTSTGHWSIMELPYTTSLLEIR